jgi:hypothetical protein
MYPRGRPVLTSRFDTLRMANHAADLLRSWDAQRHAAERNRALVPMDRNLVARVQRVADYLYRRVRRIYG